MEPDGKRGLAIRGHLPAAPLQRGHWNVSTFCRSGMHLANASSVGTRLGSRHPHAARAKDRIRFRSQPFWPLPAAVEVATDDAHRVGELRPGTSRVQDPPGH
jgi:hypothetical protein